MELSAKVEYALLALLELASHTKRDEPMQIKEIASRQGIPDRYLEQVFSSLRRAGIIHSQRGSKGGYLLSRDPWQITLLEVFSCLEESKSSKSSQESQSIDRLVLRETWQEATQATKDVLRRYTIRDLHQQRMNRQQLNTMFYI
jgi:Rrf2 family transcriptional regulator, cysteine metabolism repressor